METRKVQIIGGSTYIVSLPKKWAVENKLKHGGTMFISKQLDGTLVLRPERMKGLEKKQAKLKKIDTAVPAHLLRELIGMYISGYELIELTTVKRISPELRETIREFTRIVMGPEIIEESLKKIVLQDFIDLSDLSLRKSVRRMYLIARSMHSDAFTAISEHNTDLANDITSRDAEVDRFFWLISKQFNLILGGKEHASKPEMIIENNLDYFLVARIMERIADHAGKISQNIINLGKKKLSRGIVHSLEVISNHYLGMLEMAIEAFFKAKAEEANSAIDQTNKLEQLCDEALKDILKLDSNIAIALAFIIESMRRTGMYATDISEIAINHIVSKSSDVPEGQ